MTEWSLGKLLGLMSGSINHELNTARSAFTHSVTKGDASEHVWLKMLQTYLPKRYQAERAHVVDSNGEVSDQIDIVIFDGQYTPFIFVFDEQMFVPAEAVYAVLEAKQAITKNEVEYAQDKVASVRKLTRTSLPIPHAGGEYPAKIPMPIIGGIVTLESSWKPALGKPLETALTNAGVDGRLDIGCAAAHGCFQLDADQQLYTIKPSQNAPIEFLFELIARLQTRGTVPMIDIRAYLKQLR